jgi:DNA-binding CsgD family transcriptional regulator
MSSGSTRARIEDLTDTQRRVLDLIDEGKTNYEIGQALGITLDGAKYHVTEILNKLGVDSREEAATLVQPSASRWHRVPAKRLALGAAAAAGLLGILGILLALRDNDRRVPEVQVAFLVGQPGPDAPDRGRQITIVDSDGGTRTLGERDEYGALSWAPTGRHLLALKQRPDGFSFDVFDTLEGHRDSWEGSGLPGILEWSPDGELFAIHTRPRTLVDSTEWTVSLLRLDGHKLNEALLPPSSEPSARTGRSVIWSPDSQWILSWQGPDMTLLNVFGESRSLPPPLEFPGGSVVVVDWTGAGLRIAAQPSRPTFGGPRAWILSDPRGEWRPIDPIPTPTSAAAQHEAVQERFQPEFRLAWSDDTADGSGHYYSFTRSLIGSPSRPLADFVLVRFAGNEVTIPAPSDVYATGSMSAVIVAP